MYTPGNVGTPSLHPFRENLSHRKWKVTATGTKGCPFKVGRYENLPAGCIENLEPSDFLQFHNYMKLPIKSLSAIKQCELFYLLSIFTINSFKVSINFSVHYFSLS